MEQLLSDAKAKGMHVVEEGNLHKSFEDYERLVKEADELCEVQDPEETPFQSKYEARAKLDALCNRMEANRTIASLEKNREMIEALDWRIAATRTRLASIAWEVEEPHNAQIELEMAAEFYAPGLVKSINEMSGEADSDAALTVTSNMEPPTFRVDNGELCGDTMRCINLLGILWAGRDHAKRSFLYLLACKQFYDDSRVQEMSDGVRKEMEAALTNNLFYLAQAYGHIGNSELSSLYCHMTLQRQLNAGLEVASGLEWCKNCMGMADFHIALGDFERAAHSLSATEVVIKDLFGDDTDEGENGSRFSSLTDDDREKLRDIKADLNRRWITLDVTVLKAAFERRFSESDDDGGKEEESSVDLRRFHSLEVPPTNMLGKRDIATFDDARTVFLRCVCRLEAAKKQFPLEGFVTDHVNLVRQHSLLYHYLAGFEVDVKRKLAMELRRAEMLKEFPATLSRNAYEGLIKGVCHEIGEIYLNLFELKIQKAAQKTPKVVESPEKYLKLADLNKCNEYCAAAIAMFENFISFYSKKGNAAADDGMRSVFNGDVPVKFADLSIDELMQIPLHTPSPDMLAEEEVRPYLNAHFFICRLLSKYIPPPGSSPADRTKYTVASLHRYQWLLASAPDICQKKETSIVNVFEEEFEVCKEMVSLLPPKIDRMHYYGESGM